jgi:hypothetical protein
VLVRHLQLRIHPQPPQPKQAINPSTCSKQPLKLANKEVLLGVDEAVEQEEWQVLVVWALVSGLVQVPRAGARLSISSETTHISNSFGSWCSNSHRCLNQSSNKSVLAILNSPS